MAINVIWSTFLQRDCVLITLREMAFDLLLQIHDHKAKCIHVQPLHQSSRHFVCSKIIAPMYTMYHISTPSVVSLLIWGRAAMTFTLNWSWGISETRKKVSCVAATVNQGKLIHLEARSGYLSMKLKEAQAALLADGQAYHSRTGKL